VRRGFDADLVVVGSSVYCAAPVCVCVFPLRIVSSLLFFGVGWDL
jgi:hypothetical protein